MVFAEISIARKMTSKSWKGSWVNSTENKEHLPFSKVSMTNFSAPWSARAASLSHTRRGEGVLQVKTLGITTIDRIDLLLHTRITQSGGGNRLRLASSKECRSMDAGENTGLRIDMTNLV